jgi:hypothetical protein
MATLTHFGTLSTVTENREGQTSNLLLIQVLLKPDEHGSDFFGRSEIGHRIDDGVVLQFQQWREFVLIQFRHAFFHVLGEHEFQERFLLVREFRMDLNLSPCRSFFSG